MSYYPKKGDQLIALKEMRVYLANNFNACQGREAYYIKKGETITFDRSNDWDKSYLQVSGEINKRNEFRMDCHPRCIVDNIRYSLKLNIEDFNLWFNSGNVTKISNDTYVEQTTQYKTKFTLKELKEFYIKEYQSV